MKSFLIVIISSIVTILFFTSNVDAIAVIYSPPKHSSEFTDTNIIYLANNWYQYTAKDDSYTVFFPGKPEEENLSVDTSLGKLNALLVFYQYPEKQRFFSVSSIKYPVDSSEYNVEKGLNGARDGAAINSNSRIISEKNINYQGFPGREIILESKVKPNLRLLLRIFIDPSGPTLYSLQVVAEDGNIDFPEAKAFLDSFVIK